MNDQYLELLKQYMDVKVDPLHKDMHEVKRDIKELKEFRWKVTGIAIAASSFAGSATFSIAKLLEKLFN